ncbi:MAG TPA: carboxypeptidase regulatory-like domain-containing protein [Vicinamibacterales bacterium]|nr:carboxypeptidase regulatory-like domain-containing protein [Vicinamibacterales bacterium]
MRLIGVLLVASLPGLSSLAYAQAAAPGQTVQRPQPSSGEPQRMPARPLRPGETPPKGTGVLKGQVIASGTGAPVRRAQVRAASMESRGGGVTSTDAEGRYEIKELPAGRYTITAAKGGFVSGQFGQRRPGDPGTPIDLSDGQTADKVNFVLSRGSVISGRIVDDGGEPVAGTMVAAMRYQFVSGSRRLVPGGGEGSTDRTDDQGGFRLYGLAPGDYYVSANGRNNMMMMPGLNNTEPDAFAPTYFPGTPNVSEATRVSVKAGQEMSGANFALIVARMARIRGRALNSRGEPVANGMLMLMPDEPMMMPMTMNNAMVAGDGTFQFANVPPGRYNLQVRPGGMQMANGEFASMKITVGNDDIDNVMITTSAGATAKGVVVTDDGSVPAFRADQVMIFPAPADPGTMMINPGTNRLNEDFTFELTGLNDRRLLRPNIPATLGWYTKAVMFDGQDVTDSGIEFTPGRTYEGIQVVVTQKTTELSGLVMDDRGKPVLDATVVIFPANKDLWTYASRYVRSLRPDTNGKYNVKSLPPLDDYLIVAVQNLEQGQGSDPDFLARAKEDAKSFTLNEGETKAFDVKLSKLVP